MAPGVALPAQECQRIADLTADLGALLVRGKGSRKRKKQAIDRTLAHAETGGFFDDHLMEMTAGLLRRLDMSSYALRLLNPLLQGSHANSLGLHLTYCHALYDLGRFQELRAHLDRLFKGDGIFANPEKIAHLALYQLLNKMARQPLPDKDISKKVLDEMYAAEKIKWHEPARAMRKLEKLVREGGVLFPAIRAQFVYTQAALKYSVTAAFNPGNIANIVARGDILLGPNAPLLIFTEDGALKRFTPLIDIFRKVLAAGPEERLNILTACFQQSTERANGQRAGNGAPGIGQNAHRPSFPPSEALPGSKANKFER